MTQQDKELLLRDLCSRLPYGVNVEIEKYHIGILKGIDNYTVSTDRGINYPISIVKPYLRPMSSMTHSEYDEYLRIKTHGKPFEVIDWLNACHIDYRKLIEKGLANPITNETILLNR